ncbi:hypothetical protein ACHAXR_009732 [Thalassiosira sp. AJA248-18]
MMLLLRLCMALSWNSPVAASVQPTSMRTAAAFLPSGTIGSVKLIEGHHGEDKRCSLKRSHLFSSKRVAEAPIQEEIRYIAGRRALLLHPQPSPNKPNIIPLVILGGMAQSISSWEFHLPYLSRHRSVLIYEALGQGPPPPDEVCSIDGREVTLERYYDNVSLERQGKDFWNVVDEAFFAPGSYYYEQNELGNDATSEKVDVAGFSFGGRVAMAAASLKPNRIRRLHLTGVGAERDAFASVILASWNEILASRSIDIDDLETGEEDCDLDHASRCTSRLRSFAWSVILATYSEQFLASAGPERVKTWVDSVCRYNTEEGLRAILAQTHGNAGEEEDMWTPAAMAQRIQTSQSIENCRVVVGSQDKMANPNQALQLAELLLQSKDDETTKTSEGDTYKVMEGCGHAVPMEAMRLWRDDVLSFLGER